ncbi:MAG: tyrosine recombinase XerC, partial [Gallionella sp.]
MTQADPANDKFLQGYLAWLLNEKRYSKLTTENYARDLKRLFELCGMTALHTLKSHQIRRYIAQLHSQGLSGRSLARLLSAWRGFFNYLMRDHGLTDNPCVGMRAPKSEHALPQALSPDEAAHLMEIPDENVAAIRDKAMLELLYSSGLRLAELVDLDKTDTPKFLTDGEIRVTGKGNKTRVVPLGQFAITALQAWLAVRDQMANRDEAALFVGQRGQRIAPRVVQARLKQWGIKLGITSGVHPHLLRHSFATHV